MKKDKFKSKSEIFNCVYKSKESGETVYAKRQAKPPRFMLESGESFSVSTFRKKFSFVEVLMPARKAFESKSDFYNLLYEDENGKQYKAKRQANPPRYKLESGEIYSGTMFHKLFFFVNHINRHGQNIVRL